MIRVDSNHPGINIRYNKHDQWRREMIAAGWEWIPEGDYWQHKDSGSIFPYYQSEKDNLQVWIDELQIPTPF